MTRLRPHSALVILALLVGCGKHPTTPKPDPCVKVDTLWSENGATLILKTYHTPPCPAQRKP